MQVAASPINEVRVHAHFCDGEPSGLHYGSHSIADGIHVIVTHEVGHLSTVEDVVDVLKEGFLVYGGRQGGQY